MPDKMTLYYLKQSGKVKGYCTGEQTMSIYGDDADEYSVIMDYIQGKVLREYGLPLHPDQENHGKQIH